MSLPVRPGSFAQDEIEYYLRRYESESPGLGDRLWQDIQTAAELISDHRGSGNSFVVQVVSFAFRSGTSLSLIYPQRNDHLQIVALAHTSRKPNYWRTRLKPD